MTGPSEPIVECVDVHKVYEPTPRWLRLLARSALTEPVNALAGINLELQPGEICAVVGPNGAGKTTMFRVLAGLTTADRGHVRVGGHDPESNGRVVRGLIGWMPTERRSLFLRQTCHQNLAFHGRLRSIPEADLSRRIDEVLEMVGLPGRRNDAPQAFSDGMRARLLLARALLARPRLLLLDEPTGPIDPVAAHEMLLLIQRLVLEFGMGALISSHRLEEISALEGRVNLIDRGRTVFDGDLGELRRRQDTTVFTFTALPAMQAAAASLRRAMPAVEVVEVADDCSLVLSRPDDLSVGAVLEALGDDRSAILTVDERQRPMRELLASMYEPSR